MTNHSKRSECERLLAENERLLGWVVLLRVAGMDIIDRIVSWEAAVREIISHQPKHGIDLIQMRAALAATEKDHG